MSGAKSGVLFQGPPSQAEACKFSCICEPDFVRLYHLVVLHFNNLLKKMGLSLDLGAVCGKKGGAAPSVSRLPRVLPGSSTKSREPRTVSLCLFSGQGEGQTRGRVKRPVAGLQSRPWVGRGWSLGEAERWTVTSYSGNRGKSSPRVGAVSLH